jgi:S-adenosylmethionine:tRNA ribosyltransferase-isomerase
MSVSLAGPAFVVPPELEAREPIEARGLARDDVRLLVTRRDGGENALAGFRDFAQALREGDLLVVNDSATLPAALDARGADESELALHFSAHVAGTLWIVEPRARSGTRPLPEPRAAGDRLALPGGATATLLAPVDPNAVRLWFARVELGEDAVEYLHAYGRPIRYAYVEREFTLANYQTIFARVPGSAEMPSAARPFTARSLEQLRARGVSLATVTLHAGVSSLEAHEAPYAEPYAVSPATARAVNAARAAGRRVIAVGTTVVRALESAFREGDVVAAEGWTELVVTRERGLNVVDGLLTGLHEPRASHLRILEALLPDDELERAYRAALDARLLWHEFGDVHLIV